jgi:hypothetical protein
MGVLPGNMIAIVSSSVSDKRQRPTGPVWPAEPVINLDVSAIRRLLMSAVINRSSTLFVHAPATGGR